MATISCTPADLAAAAKCFQCLPSEQKQWIDTYLLAVIAKGSTDPNTLATAAKCFQCIPPGMLRRIQAYLLCQIASGGGGGPCPQDMQVAWTPTNLKLGEELGFFTFGDIPGITSIIFHQSASVSGFDIESTTSLTSLSWPNLTSVDPSNIQGGYLAIYANTALTSLSLPILATVNGNLTIDLNTVLNSISAPSLTSVGKTVTVGGPAMTSISFPALTTSGTFSILSSTLLTSLNISELQTTSGLVINSTALTSLALTALQTTGAFAFDISGNSSLSTLSVPVFVPTNGQAYNASGCALDAASVNAFLHRAVLNVGYVTGLINLSGGTNAAPSGQGIADKATLIGRGVTVNTN